MITLQWNDGYEFCEAVVSNTKAAISLMQGLSKARYRVTAYQDGRELELSLVAVKKEKNA